MSTGPKSIKVNMTLKMVEEIVSFLYPLVTSMYVIRTIGKQNYGEIQYARSIINYFSLLASLGIGSYAAREGAKIRDDKKTFQQFSNEIFSINCGATFAALFLLFIYIIILAQGDNSASIPLYLIGAVSIAFSLIGRTWINTVYEDYLFVTVRYILTCIVNAAIIFIFIHNENDYILYFFLLTSVSCVVALINNHHVCQYSRIGFSRYNDYHRHLSSIFMLFFSGISAKIYLNSDVTLLGIMINNEAVAIYSVAATLYTMTKQITNSVISVTIPRLSYYTGMHNDLQFHVLIEKMIDYVMVLIFPSVVGLCELRVHAMVFLGGIQYAEGGATLLVLALALPFAVISNILSQGVLLPRKKEKVFLISTIISALVNIVFNIIIIPICGYIGAAITTLLSEIVMFCFIIYETRKEVVVVIHNRTLITVLFGCIIVALICEIIKRSINNIFICLLAAIILSVLAYFIILAIRKHPSVVDIKELFLRRTKRC